jgi:hypothetical protein
VKEFATGSNAEDAFWHEFYHLFEIQNDIVTWWELAENQFENSFQNNVYDYDPNKPFMEQNPEARAKYFAGCMSGGPCKALSEFYVRIYNGPAIRFNGFTFEIIDPKTPIVFVDVNENGIDDDK